MKYEGDTNTGRDEAVPNNSTPPYSDLDETTSKPSSRTVWIIAITALAIILGIWFLLRSGKDEPVDTSKSQVPVVSIIAPGQTNVVDEISATGTLAARRPMPIGSVGEGGQVREVRVDAGDWVEQGQILAVIDRSVQVQAAASQAAQIEASAADARIAQSNLDRGLKLIDRGFISKADIDRLTATRDAAVARVNMARASLGQLNAQNARLNIVAPASGLVLERNVELGQVVSGGSGVLFSLAKGGEMELLANLAENDLATVSVGVEAQVTPVGQSKTFTGQIWQIAPVIDNTSRQGTARIALPYDSALRPGGFASAVIKSRSITAPVLPESAIQNDAKGSFVYIVDNDNKARRRAVTAGIVTPQGIVVKSGLSGSEKVVMRAGGFLNDGDTVKPRAITPSAPSKN